MQGDCFFISIFSFKMMSCGNLLYAVDGRIVEPILLHMGALGPSCPLVPCQSQHGGSGCCSLQEFTWECQKWDKKIRCSGVCTGQVATLLFNSAHRHSKNNMSIATTVQAIWSSSQQTWLEKCGFTGHPGHSEKIGCHKHAWGILMIWPWNGTEPGGP